MSKVSSVRRDGAFRNSLPVTVRCKGTSTSKPQLHSIQPYYVPLNDSFVKFMHSTLSDLLSGVHEPMRNPTHNLTALYSHLWIICSS